MQSHPSIRDQPHRHAVFKVNKIGMARRICSKALKFGQDEDLAL